MTYLERLSDWVSAHRAEIEQLGSVRFTRGPEHVPNPSASVVVELAGAEVELLLWVTGEAEFSYGTFSDPTFDHVEVETPEQLDALLRRFLDTVINGGM